MNFEEERFDVSWYLFKVQIALLKLSIFIVLKIGDDLSGNLSVPTGHSRGRIKASNFDTLDEPIKDTFVSFQWKVFLFPLNWFSYALDARLKCSNCKI